MMLSCIFLALCGPQDPVDARKLYREGQYVEAAKVFGEQAAADPDNAETQYNLGVSLWRTGDLRGAEAAAERYAALPGGGRIDLHRGLLGNVRYAEAEALAEVARAPAGPMMPSSSAGSAQPGGQPAEPPSPMELLQQALAKARRARDEFLAASEGPLAEPQIGRNVERSLQLIKQIEKAIEELEKQQQDQEQQDGEEGEEGDEQSDEPNEGESEQSEEQNEQQNEEQSEQQEQESEEQQQQGEEQNEEQNEQNEQQEEREGEGQNQEQENPEQGHERPEPQQEDPEEGQEKPEPQAGEQEQEEPQDKGRNDAPGEQLDMSKLSPEQRQRLLEQLQKLDEQLQKIRAQARSRRPAVERDW